MIYARDSYHLSRTLSIRRSGSGLLQIVEATLRWGERLNFESRRRRPNNELPVNYEVAPSPDFLTMTLLFMVDKIPAGIYADRLQEDHPETEPVAQFLREWEQIKQQEEQK